MERITIIEGNSENMDETIIDFQSNNKILQIIEGEVDQSMGNSKDETSKL